MRVQRLVVLALFVAALTGAGLVHPDWFLTATALAALLAAAAAVTLGSLGVSDDRIAGRDRDQRRRHPTVGPRRRARPARRPARRRARRGRVDAPVVNGPPTSGSDGDERDEGAG